MTQALAGIEQAIAELTERHKPFQTNLVRLLTLPGVVLKVVLPLLVKLFQWQNMTSGEGEAAGLVAYIGLDPQPYESDRSVRKHAGISKMGDSEVRRLLYMGALGGVRRNNPLKPFYQRLVGCGKAKKLRSLLPPQKFSFGPGPSSLAKLTGILIFIKSELDNYEGIWADYIVTNDMAQDNVEVV